MAVPHPGFATVPKALDLHDTFHGIPDTHNPENRPNTLYEGESPEDPDAILKHVRTAFGPCPDVRIAPGAVPSLRSASPGALPRKASPSSHTGMDPAASGMAAPEHLFDRVSPGGMIVFDDRGWHAYSARKDAEGAFMAERGHRVPESPAGQGLAVRRG